jgi:hypothetical protein
MKARPISFDDDKTMTTKGGLDHQGRQRYVRHYV